MTCPKLAELPAPPPGLTGWPWTEGSAPLPPKAGDGGEWPRISVVTPSYNQGRFIEETIRSVLLQGYPDLEYFVVDGGSTDGSVEIIEKYAPWLSGWTSERDRGQVEAINKGLRRASGRIFAFLNSDDVYLPGVLAAVAGLWSGRDGGRGWLCTSVAVAQQGRAEQVVAPTFDGDAVRFMAGWGDLHQVGTFYDLEAVRAVGGLDEELHYVFDRDLWIRLLLAGREPRRRPDLVVGRVRMHPDCKSMANLRGFAEERALLPGRYRAMLPERDRRRLDGALADHRRFGELSRLAEQGRFLSCVALLVGAPRMLLRRYAWGAMLRAARGGSAEAAT